jgi:hypothetical protein
LKQTGYKTTLKNFALNAAFYGGVQLSRQQIIDIMMKNIYNDDNEKALRACAESAARFFRLLAPVGVFGGSKIK